MGFGSCQGLCPKTRKETTYTDLIITPMTQHVKDESHGIVWEVFIQSKPGIPHKHAGSVHAHDAESALTNARDVYTRRKEGVSIWVIPANLVTASAGEDSDSLFDPADDKAYRHPTFYTVPEGVKYL